MRLIIRNYATDVACEAGTLTAGLNFPADFDGFRGHFPGQPIVPGICWVQAALLFGEILLARRLLLREIVLAKFFAGIGPGQDVRVTCKVNGSVLETDYVTSASRVARITMGIADA